jgi:hypothetical protein
MNKIIINNEREQKGFEMVGRGPDLTKEDWMQRRWRPMMGWVYMVTCTTDFILFPILWSMLQASIGSPVTAWDPITLKGAGLYHVAMGAVLGLTAFGRTQEKIAGASQTSAVSRPAKTDEPAL